jgi:hypothetical protein
MGLDVGVVKITYLDRPAEPMYDFLLQAWDRAVNRFVMQFTEKFCDEAGNVLWEELVSFNSGKPTPKKQ